MTAEKEDKRLARMESILTLRHGPRWMTLFPLAAGLPKSTVWAVFSGKRGFTPEIYERLLAAIDQELERMEVDLSRAKAIRAKLK